jgi:predicted enzyme related to lactoylglutathione lyase
VAQRLRWWLTSQRRRSQSGPGRPRETDRLHRFGVEHDHGAIGNPEDKPYGNGVLLWFEIDDFDAAMARVADLNADVLLPKHRNPPSGDGGPNHWECWLRDPDGYTVVLASPDGSATDAPSLAEPLA